MKETLHILFFVFQTGNRANGGVESVSRVIEGLASSHKIHVISNIKTNINFRWRNAGASVCVTPTRIRLGEGPFSRGVLGFFRWICAVLRTNLHAFRYIRRHEISVVHCNDPGPFFYIAPAVLLSRKKLVLNLRDTKANGEAISRLKYRFYFRCATRVIVLSEEMSRFYAGFADCAEKLLYIYSAIDYKKFFLVDKLSRKGARERLGISDEEFAVGFVAAFNDKKNQLEFIREAGSYWGRELPHFRLYFIGDFDPDNDSYARGCVDAWEEAGAIKNFVFAGFSDVVVDWYRSLDLVIIPTRKEGLARCMIEALACGTPVVSFDVASAHEILTKYKLGCVVPQGDYRAMLEAIKDYREMPQSEWDDLCAAGARVASDLFSPTQVVQSYEKLYLGLSKAD